MIDLAVQFAALKRQFLVHEYPCGHFLCLVNPIPRAAYRYPCPACQESDAPEEKGWLPVPRSCGHTILEHFGGRFDTRAKRVAQRGELPCEACRKQEREDRFIKDGSEALVWSAQRELPQLKGTSLRQIAFGELRRRRAIECLAELAQQSSASEEDSRIGWLVDTFDDATFWIEYGPCLETGSVELVLELFESDE